MKNKQKSIKILLMIAFVIIIFSGSKLDLFSQSYCGDDPNCTANWVYHTEWLVIPEFPQCSIYVDYKTRDCGDYTTISINGIYSENEYNMNSGCNILTSIYPMWPNQVIINWAAVKLLFEGAYAKIGLNIFEQITANYTDLDKDNYLCESNNWVTTVNYFMDVCNKYCLEVYNEQVVGAPSPTAVLHVISWACTNEYCCKVENNYCFSKNGTPPIYTTNIFC